jgi:Fe-S oxidoreductase
MVSTNTQRDHSSFQEAESRLHKELKKISEKCISCEFCQKECEFLKRYGKPKEIANAYHPTDKTFQAMPFECSLCQLCAAVCPEKINPAEMFLEMRREKMRRNEKDYPEHNGMLAYERRGTSKRYTYYAIPAGCDTVFFPGCTLPGTRPDKTFKLYEHMKKKIPKLGIVLDCCMKISHDLGRKEVFTAMFQEMKNFLVEKGVQRVLVACPNCHRIFKEYGEELAVKTVYEVLAENGLLKTGTVSGSVTIHDPCALRFEDHAHSAVRDLVRNQGLTIEEMPHHRNKTLCCGEGGFVGCLSPDLAKNWGATRREEADGRRTITYCAGCTNLLNRVTPASHVLDLLFEPGAALAGKARVSSAPITYINRLRLKSRLKKTVDARITRERTFTTDEEAKKGGMLKRLLLLVAILIVILAVRFTGTTRYLEQGALREWIQGYGALAPLIYMLIYTIAPALLLPGLPITLAGGILFGPFWGVLYTITSAT